jgi:hypothetical protein
MTQKEAIIARLRGNLARLHASEDWYCDMPIPYYQIRANLAKALPKDEVEDKPHSHTLRRWIRQELAEQLDDMDSPLNRTGEATWLGYLIDVIEKHFDEIATDPRLRRTIGKYLIILLNFDEPETENLADRACSVDTWCLPGGWRHPNP